VHEDIMATILITGAGGKLGQSVAAELARHGAASATRLATRDPSKLAPFAAQGFEIVRADYDDAQSIDAALSGIQTLLLITSNGLTADRIRQDKSSMDAAKKAGVQRIVYTSFVNPHRDSKYVWAGVYAETEPYLKSSGMEYTILRICPYCSNLGLLIGQAKATGVFTIPGAEGSVAYVRHGDLGAAAAAALLESSHKNKIYELTGSEAFDAAGVAGLLSQALGRDIVSRAAPPEEFGAYLRSVKVPEFIIEGLLTSYAAAAAGEYAAVSDDIKTLSGRPAGSLRDFVRELGA
jgi:NAD(P)H dehydrogenase (quinone)